MSRIDDRILDSVVFLYPTTKDAEESAPAGGTGFLVAVPFSNDPNRGFVYVVTASHVIREGKATVLRLNTAAGGLEIVEIPSDDWIHHPDGDDLALAGYLEASWPDLRTRIIPSAFFITAEIIQQFEIGPGDETFMVGRFSTHDGHDQNLPSVRFGNIAMMPREPVKHARGIRQESFLVETRSLGGYSGSPVFVRIPSGSVRPKMRTALQANPSAGTPFALAAEMGPWLLGVDYGHLPIRARVRKRDGSPSRDDTHVETNSGMMGVVPAWRIHGLLNSPELVEDREVAERAETS